MKVAIAVDHRGFPVKQDVIAGVQSLGHEVVDLGVFSHESVDYPDQASAVGDAVVGGNAERGILVCGSGVGACIAANKIAGVRAAVCHDIYSAHQGVEHDDMNVLCLGAGIVGPALIRELVACFLSAIFSDADARFVRRLCKVKKLERGEILEP